MQITYFFMASAGYGGGGGLEAPPTERGKGAETTPPYDHFAGRVRARAFGCWLGLLPSDEYVVYIPPSALLAGAAR